MRTLPKIPFALTLAAAVALAPRVASAAEDQEQAAAVPKGTVGGVLLGAEVVMLTEAAFKVKPAWAYIVGGLAGGAAGGAAGWFLVDEGGDANAKGAMYMLAGGMALMIPTTVAVLSAAAYEPPADYTEDKGPKDEPVAEPAQPGAAPSAAPPAAAPPPAGAKAPTRRRVASHAPALYRQPPALIGVGPRSVTLSVPAVEVRDVYRRSELQRYGVKQQTELRFPVLSYVF